MNRDVLWQVLQSDAGKEEKGSLEILGEFTDRIETHLILENSGEVTIILIWGKNEPLLLLQGFQCVVPVGVRVEEDETVTRLTHEATAVPL